MDDNWGTTSTSHRGSSPWNPPKMSNVDPFPTVDVQKAKRRKDAKSYLHTIRNANCQLGEHEKCVVFTAPYCT